MIEKNKWFYEQDFSVTYYQIEHNKALKPSTLLNFLQDMATNAADKLFFGYDVMYPKNLCWFLIKYRMEFEEYPVDVKELKLFTEARGISKLMAQRDFEIYSKDGKLFGRVLSNWLIADITTRNIVPVKDVFPQMPPIEKREDELKFDKIRPIERMDFQEVFKIRYDDLDVNEHVNNANYITWALETIPYDFRNTHRIKYLDIYFKKEVRYGGNVVSEVMIETENLLTTHVIKSQESQEELCLVKVQWVEV